MVEVAGYCWDWVREGEKGECGGGCERKERESEKQGVRLVGLGDVFLRNEGREPDRRIEQPGIFGCWMDVVAVVVPENDELV
jgi:hypothetical protein